MKIAFAASEVVPYAKTGGLADVAGALPKALEQLGHEVRVFMPLYSDIDQLKHGLEPLDYLGWIGVKIGNTTRYFSVRQGQLPDSTVPVYFIDCPDYFHRGSIYTSDWDENERFILFSRAVIITMQWLGFSPDVMHCNDWQTGLIPAYLRTVYAWDALFRHTACLFSIHNVAYQGRFAADTVYKAGLPASEYYLGGPFEFYNSFSFMKIGILYSQVVNAVSETYAHEIMTPDFAHGMDSVLRYRARDVHGVVNGVDYSVWNPETDRLIPRNYSANEIQGKRENKRALMQTMNLGTDDKIPVVGIVSRLTPQKGFDLLPDMFSEMMKFDFRIAVLASGDQRYEDFFRWAAAAYPDKIGYYAGYNNELSHLIEAGSDMFLMPSQYEPCGLNQMYSLKYGTVPIVRKTGGLADTVNDYHETEGNGEGFSFLDYSPLALYLTVRRGIIMYNNHKDKWQEIIQRGMKKNYSWEVAARKYEELYQKARFMIG